MTKEEAIKYLQQLYPNGGHCWLDEQRMEAIGMAIQALQEEPVNHNKLNIMLDEALSKETSKTWNERLDKEPVSKYLWKELDKYLQANFTIDKEQLDRFGIEEKDYMYSMDKSDMLALVEHFINWHKTKEESVSEDLEEACEQLAENARKHKAETSNPFFSPTDYKQDVIDGAAWQKQKDSIVSEGLEEAMQHNAPNNIGIDDLLYWRNGFIAGANWQKQQMMKEAISGEVKEGLAVGYFGWEDYGWIETDTFRIEKYALKANDKVKLIIFKED